MKKQKILGVITKLELLLNFDMRRNLDMENMEIQTLGFVFSY